MNSNKTKFEAIAQIDHREQLAVNSVRDAMILTPQVHQLFVPIEGTSTTAAASRQWR
jgi:hypothetical protein